MKLDHFLITTISYQTHTQNDSKWIKDFNVRPETIKFLEENKGGNLIDIGLGNDILDLTPKAKTTKAKIDKWDYFKLKSSSQKRKPSTK